MDAGVLLALMGRLEAREPYVGGELADAQCCIVQSLAAVNFCCCVMALVAGPLVRTAFGMGSGFRPGTAAWSPSATSSPCVTAT